MACIIYVVELWAWANGKKREVKVPYTGQKLRDVKEVLEDIFKWGQNDFQPLPLPSVSVGDVAIVGSKRYRCCGCGWRELEPGEDGTDFGLMGEYKRGGKSGVKCVVDKDGYFT